ncbi:Peptidase C19 ubiquitin carboxyl-terminal hydrolase 2 [Penicillium cf. griseofulvum]|nr:Peptidase C19 ubiquitin carboxyl-terminal hydrolase 2 [Penicillium cf. griseofulvum]
MKIKLYCHLITPEASRIAFLDLSSLLWRIDYAISLPLFFPPPPGLRHNHALSPSVAAWIYHVLRCGDFAISPKIPPWKDRQRPCSVGGDMNSSGQVNRPDLYSKGKAPLIPPRRPRFPNIKDLQDQAAALNVDDTTPLSILLPTAADAIERARNLADDNYNDKAYVQYLRASEITINIIPHHPDYRTISQHPNLYKEFADLVKAVRSKQGTMDAIKQDIIEDNLVSGMQPTGIFTSRSPEQNSVAPRGRENQGSGTNLARMPSPTEYQRMPDKKAHLQRFSSPPDDMLAQRFAKLKASPPSDQYGLGASIAGPGSPVLGSAGQTSLHSSNGSLGTYSSQLPRRPLGPRDMGSSSSLPTIPPKVPLNTSLPRAPDPAYSPVFTVPSKPTSNPPRSSAESTRSGNPRYSQFSNSPRVSPTRGGFDDNPYRSLTPNGLDSARETRSNSPDLPYNTTITAQSLLENLRKFNVLLIDVRARGQYDNGHIYAKSIICIEPVILKENVSAEELEERLVVSPDHEQALFEKRNEFDLVVYYDQSANSISYLAGSPVGTSAPHLRALHDTLYEFNAYKPLKAGRPPALLLGGLDAWVDLLGQQSLATSSTTAIMSSLQARKPVSRPGRPLGRVPTMASANSSLEIRKRRLREFTPLNSKELSEWMEKSKVEEIDTSTYTEEDSLTEEPEENEPEETGPEPSSPFIHSYEAFLRRFPEPHDVKQSMSHVDYRPPPTVAPNYAAHISVAPSRPPPAVPRPSYSGVSDGRHIQPHLKRQNSANQTALYVSNSRLDRLKLPRTGLTNFGVTCYMNSTIQCLSATISLSRFFIDNRFRHYVQKNWKGSQGVMPGLYANLTRSLWKNDVEVIMPTSFRNFCGRLNREWAIDRQQDAKEFFDFVVDCLHEDLNINWQRTPLRPLTFSEEMQRERMPMTKVSRIEWDRYCHREESFISSLFAGQHASRLRCTTCRQTSTTYEAFYSISVEIPPTGAGDIYQCLRSYCQEEMLSGDERTKDSHPHRIPASWSTNGRFCDCSPSPPPPEAGAPPTTGATVPPFTYDAFAVLRHIGSSMGSGHYISLVRDAERQCWRKFDDERATDFNPRDLRARDRLQNEQAYIVFYERVPAK